AACGEAVDVRGTDTAEPGPHGRGPSIEHLAVTGGGDDGDLEQPVAPVREAVGLHVDHGEAPLSERTDARHRCPPYAGGVTEYWTGEGRAGRDGSRSGRSRRSSRPRHCCRYEAASRARTPIGDGTV